MDVRRVLAAPDVVGESAVWDDRRKRLIWVISSGAAYTLLTQPPTDISYGRSTGGQPPSDCAQMVGQFFGWSGMFAFGTGKARRNR
jgi:hypothetical protein